MVTIPVEILEIASRVASKERQARRHPIFLHDAVGNGSLSIFGLVAGGALNDIRVTKALRKIFMAFHSGLEADADTMDIVIEEQPAATPSGDAATLPRDSVGAYA